MLLSLIFLPARAARSSSSDAPVKAAESVTASVSPTGS
jgi:hypothetical protein